ncbi:MAG: 16S rRNA processing protein RimM [Deltaproteobacteria bacterium]|nr:16S rRNA processing protein RimM [Deltaproteobacteria bacterium]
MGKTPTEDLLLLGKVIRPHGLEGLLRVYSFAQSEDIFLEAGTVFIRSDREQPYRYRVISAKKHKNLLVMRLDGLNSRYDAEKLRGAEILVRRDTIKAKKEDEYFWFELIGLKVYLVGGRYIGTLEDIFSTGSNDIYVVREGDKEYLIPAIHDVIKDIDLIHKNMVIREMEGLLDLNEV